MTREIDEYWRHHRAQQALYDASCTIRDGSLMEALDALDRVDVDCLTAHEIAHWFNGRAYVLALMGDMREALEHLHEAEELIVGLDDMVVAPSHDVLVSCIIGTRGIALLHGGV